MTSFSPEIPKDPSFQQRRSSKHGFNEKTCVKILRGSKTNSVLKVPYVGEHAFPLFQNDQDTNDSFYTHIDLNLVCKEF